MKTSYKRSPAKSCSRVFANLATFAPAVLKTLRDARKDKSRSMHTQLAQEQSWDNEGGRFDEMLPNGAFARQNTKKDAQ